jgi:hypothetical protein
MTWLDKVERRIGFIAVPGLIKIVVALTALVYVLTYVNPQFISVLQLDPAAIRRGEVWRLFTYLFIPRSIAEPGSMLGPLWTLIALWFLWFIGEGLERAWGAFRLTLYFLVGMMGTTVAAFVFGAQFSNMMLASTLFFAFAWFYPDEVIYVFFILPMKIKWLAWISAALLMVGFVTGTNGYRVALLVATSNFFIFFGPQLFYQARHRQEVSSRRKRFELQSRNVDAEPLHRCATCGATELSDASLDFRVASDGEEYCMKHLPSAATAAR